MTSLPRVDDRVRGALLGAALGDAVSPPTPDTTVLATRVATQLLCVSTDGFIRTLTREVEHPDVMWISLVRWAVRRGIQPAIDAKHLCLPQYDGYLGSVRELLEERGKAPSIFTAVRTKTSYEAASSAEGRGYQVLIRVLPGSFLYPTLQGQDDPNGQFLTFSRKVAAQTHGLPRAVDAAGEFAALIRTASQSSAQVPIQQIIEETSVHLERLRHPSENLPKAIAAGREADGIHGARTLAELAPDGSAMSALRGGAFCALRADASGTMESAMSLASTAPHPRSVEIVTGAILGAARGADYLDSAARLDMAFVLHRLGRDMALELLLELGRREYNNTPEARQWLANYPPT